MGFWTIGLCHLGATLVFVSNETVPDYVADAVRVHRKYGV